MKPLPETEEAVEELDAYLDDGQLMDQLLARAGRVQALVPDLVGLSVARLDQHLTFTLVATSAEVAVLDAVQYLAGGPCVAGALSNETVDFYPDDPLDESRWHLFAQATSVASIRSTLTLPIMTNYEVVGSINLYAASRTAFDGQHHGIADIFEAWAPGAVANADLSFATRREAELTPQRVRDQAVIETTVGLTAAWLAISPEAAGTALRDAAARAGVGVTELARTVLDSRELPPELSAHQDPEDPGNQSGTKTD